jgi:hypothetical protein
LSRMIFFSAGVVVRNELRRSAAHGKP